MDTQKITQKSVAELQMLMEQGELTSEALVFAYLEEIKKRDGDIHAFLEVYDDALAQAKDTDTRRAKGEKGALLGIPVALKDNLLMKGKIASSASKILEHYVATYDAEVVKRLKDAGAVLIGRTNMDEFAFGSSTENSAFGPTKNPHDTSRVPGGSSGGSAAAVAADFVPLALGSDTGGSIRQPAALCGVVGLKPTYGAVSRRGVMAMGSSLDQIGPFARSVEEAEVLFEVIAGYDEKDSTSLPEETRSNIRGEKGVPEKMRIGVPEDFVYTEGVDEDVQERFQETLEALKAQGNEIVPVALPSAKYGLAAYYIIMPAEVSTNLARFDGIRYGLSEDASDSVSVYTKTRGKGFGKETRRRVMLGTYVLSAGYYDAYYNKATKVRESIRNDFQKAFEDVDVIVTPTSPTPAFKTGEKTKDPLQMYMADIFTVPVNIAGVPAISVPMGKVDRDGAALPIGFHVIAPDMREDILFALGKDVEKIYREE
ncbi:MAG: Asp-tRNA(Asn)/Glu-tRNA(Gln) amidotransferase subunit GatA [Parcubacteria group bacterium]|nr:Asp-tRNA(Asn)/Glu-tRNA(Gln) amidotransferase subunit GatA [Parcubacteria group bacterium]